MKRILWIAGILALSACSVGIPGTSASVGANVDANGTITPSGNLGVKLF